MADVVHNFKLSVKCVRVWLHLSLCPSPPGIREDGADDALGAGVARRGHFRDATV